MLQLKIKMRIFLKILKVLAFIFIGMFIVAAAILLTFYGSGYRFDLNTRQVFRTGLIIIDSRPRGANVYLNGKLLKKKTASRIENLKPGDYTVRIEKGGFSTWEKALTVKGTLVTWAQYVLLFSNDLAAETDISDVTDFSLSHNEKRIAAMQPKKVSGAKVGYRVVFFDPSKKETIKETDLMIKGAEVLNANLAEFTADDNSVLVRSVKDVSKPDYEWYHVKLDGTVTDIEERFGFEMTNLTAHPKNSSEYYWQDNSKLYLINFDSRAVRLIASDVISFSAIENALYTIRKTPTGNTLMRGTPEGDRTEEVVAALANAASYQISYTNFDNAGTVVVFIPELADVVLVPKAGVSIELPFKPEFVLLDPMDEKGRYLYMKNKDGAQVYDFEDGKTFDFKPAALSAWMFTGSHLLNIDQGELIASDFDGTNRRSLAKDAAGPFTSSEPLKKIFFLSTVNNGGSDRFNLLSIDLKKSF